MTREEHKNLKETEARATISKVARLLQKPEELIETDLSEIYECIDSLEKLEHAYNHALNTIGEIESKLYHFFD